VKLLNLVPALATLAAFGLLGALVWLRQSGRLRLASARGVGLLGLLGLLLVTPFAFVLPLFGPTRRVARLETYSDARGALLLVEGEALLPPWMGVNAVYRLSVLDAQSGARRARVAFEVGPPGGLEAAVRRVALVGDQLWYRTGAEGLHARDPRTGRVTLSERELRRDLPVLADERGGKVETPDGFVFVSVDATGPIELVRTPAASTRAPHTLPLPLPQETADGLAFDGTTLVSMSAGRQQWALALERPPSALAATEGSLYVAVGGELVGLDRAAGTLLFRVRP
jgi:hypothetical protein